MLENIINSVAARAARAAGDQFTNIARRSEKTIGVRNVISGATAIVQAMDEGSIDTIPIETLIYAANGAEGGGQRAVRILADRIRANRNGILPVLGDSIANMPMDTDHAPIWDGIYRVARNAREEGHIGPQLISKIAQRYSVDSPPQLASCGPVCSTMGAFINRTDREILERQGYGADVLRNTYDIVNQARTLASAGVRRTWTDRVDRLQGAINRKFGRPPAIVIERRDVEPPPDPIVI